MAAPCGPHRQCTRRPRQPSRPSRPSSSCDRRQRSAATTFALLSSPVRLHLVWLVAHGSYDVGTLAERVGMSVAAVSQHLAKLRLAGVISGQRDGRRQLYTVNDPHVLTLIQQIFDHIAPDGSLAPDPPTG